MANSKTTVWQHRDSALNPGVKLGFVPVSKALAEQLVAAGDADHPRIGEYRFKRISRTSAPGAQPVLNTMAPQFGIVNVAHDVTFNGANFTTASKVFLDDVQVTTVFVSPTVLTAVLQSTVAAVKPVNIRTPGEANTATKNFAFTLTALLDDGQNIVTEDEDEDEDA